MRCIVHPLNLEGISKNGCHHFVRTFVYHLQCPRIQDVPTQKLELGIKDGAAQVSNADLDDRDDCIATPLLSSSEASVLCQPPAA